jgi:hypothetical protein
MADKNSLKPKNRLRVVLALGGLVAAVGLTSLVLAPKGLEISQADATKALLSPTDFPKPVNVLNSISFGDQPSPIFGVPAVEDWHTFPINTFVHSGPDCNEDASLRAMLSSEELGEVLTEIDYQTPKESDQEVFWRSGHLSQTVYKFKSEASANDFLIEVKKGLLTQGCFTSESNGNIDVDVILRASSTLNEKFGLNFDSSIYFSTHRRFWIVGHEFHRNENYWTSTGVATKEKYLFLTQVTNFEYGEAEDKLLEKAFLNFESLLAKLG